MGQERVWDKNLPAGQGRYSANNCTKQVLGSQTSGVWLPKHMIFKWQLYGARNYFLEIICEKHEVI